MNLSITYRPVSSQLSIIDFFVLLNVYRTFYFCLMTHESAEPSVLPLTFIITAFVQCTTISLGLQSLMKPRGGDTSVQSFYHLLQGHLFLGLQSLMSLFGEDTSTLSFYQLVYSQLSLGLQSLMSQCGEDTSTQSFY
jgi:hypothetical protein